MKKICIGCGIYIFLLLSGCAANDHSRNIPLKIIAEPYSCIYMHVNFIFDKQSDERSTADSNANGELSIPFLK